MGRTPCCEKAGLKKGPWTPEEDQKLIDYIHKHGPGNWRALPKNAGLQRCGKSCRLRWTNYLRPDIKRGRFTFEEEESIIQLHSILGNKWSAIAAKLPGRTDNEIKNYWNTHIRKRLLRMGIDPVTHGPRLDLFDLPAILSSLQNSSFLNMPALFNLQSLLNPELLRLATSLASSQNGIQSSLSPSVLDNSFASNYLVQNQADARVQFGHKIESQIQNFASVNGTQVESNATGHQSNISNIKMEQSGFPLTDHVKAETSSNWCGLDQENLCLATDHTAFMSNNSNQSGSNNSNLSSLLSTPCSSPANALDGSLMFLSSSPSEDEIESFFSNIVNKLDNPAILNACSS